MAKFILRRLLLMLLTMFLVSVAVFTLTSAAPGNVARNVLGIQISPEQEASFLAQNGLDKPLVERYISWLIGTDWRASAKMDMPLKRITTAKGFKEWWAVEEDGSLVRWNLEGQDLITRKLQTDGSVIEELDNTRWQVNDPQAESTRLQAFREELLKEPQITEAVRQAILQHLDRILETLSSSSQLQSQEALLSELEEPEGALKLLEDNDAARLKKDLQNLSKEFVGNNSLLQALVIYQRLNSPSADELKTSDLQFMASQVSRAVAKVRTEDPALSELLGQAYESLKAGEAQAAKEALSEAAPRLSYLTGTLGTMAEGFQNVDYLLASEVLLDLSDPEKTPLDETQMMFLPDTLQEAGKALESTYPELGETLLSGYDSLEAGLLDEARNSFTRAAELTRKSGKTISRTDLAREAQVGRFFWGVDTQNHAVLWETGSGREVWVFIQGTGWLSFTGGPVEYIPLQKGLVRGDPGISFRTGRPVEDLLFIRLRNSLVLAGIAFLVVMPLALVLGIIAGLREGKTTDKFLSPSAA